MPYLSCGARAGQCQSNQILFPFFIVLHPHFRARWAQLRNGVAGTLLRIDSTVPAHACLGGVNGLRKDPGDRPTSWAKREPKTVSLVTNSNDRRYYRKLIRLLAFERFADKAGGFVLADRTLRTATAKLATRTPELTRIVPTVTIMTCIMRWRGCTHNYDT
jgi:hypothetical protein